MCVCVCVCVMLHEFLPIHSLRQVLYILDIFSQKTSHIPFQKQHKALPLDIDLLMSWTQTTDATCKYQAFQLRFRDLTCFSLSHF